MRILAITSLYPNPFQPNLAMFNCQQFKALGALHPLAIISPISWTRELAARWRGKEKLPADRRLERDGVPIVHPRFLFPPKVFRRWYGHCYRRCIRKAFETALAEFVPDVVLAAWAYPDGWTAVQLAHEAGLPVAIKVHGSDILTIDRTSPRWSRTAEALQEAEGIIAVSQDLAEKAATYGVHPGKVRVVYNGVDAELFYPAPPEDARKKLGIDKNLPMLLYVGNLFVGKGVDILVDACGQLKKQGLRFGCYIIGAGEMKGPLERQIDALGLKNEVHMMGPRAHRDLPDWFRAADALVLPSYSEGVPNVLLEAFACGTRFVATRVGGIPEVAHLGTGWLVPPGDPDALAQGIRNSLDASSTRFAANRPQMRSHADAAQELAVVLEQARERYRRKVNDRLVLR